MIFYFSGTGNSYAAARFLSERLGEGLVDIAQAMQEDTKVYHLREGERLGFVFPVYAWAPPKAVLEFLGRLKLAGAENPYTFGVCTCGGSAGETFSVLREHMEKNGLKLDSAFSVIMPDNYIVMFQVDSLERQEEILAQAEETMERIAGAILEGKRKFMRVKKGGGAALLTQVVNPFFTLFATRTKPFYATADCIGCGLCAQVCTSHCIRILDGMPRWEREHCNMCMACINRCPQKAIQYGSQTKDKGRYVHPDEK